MRPDQIARLNDLTERLADAFLMEAEPDEWPGSNETMSEWSRETRGDRVWAKKNAMSTGGVLRYTMDLATYHEGKVPATDPKAAERESDMDRKIADAERRATSAVERVIAKASSGG
jgi:hypothetical protein